MLRKWISEYLCGGQVSLQKFVLAMWNLTHFESGSEFALSQNGTDAIKANWFLLIISMLSWIGFNIIQI